MDKLGIEIGQQYAFRENVRRHDEPIHVEVVASSRVSHWRMRFLDGNDEGIVQQTKSANLVWRWSENKARLKEESQHDSLVPVEEVFALSALPSELHPLLLRRNST